MILVKEMERLLGEYPGHTTRSFVLCPNCTDAEPYLFDFEFLKPGPLSSSCSRGIGIPHNCTKRRSIELEKIVPPEGITIVSHIYAPRFVTLVLVESIVEAYMQVLTFYLANTPPLVVDVYIGTLYCILLTDIEAGSTPVCLRFSRPPETRILLVKIDRQRLATA